MKEVILNNKKEVVLISTTSSLKIYYAVIGTLCCLLRDRGSSNKWEWMVLNGGFTNGNSFDSLVKEGCTFKKAVRWAIEEKKSRVLEFEDFKAFAKYYADLK